MNIISAQYFLSKGTGPNAGVKAVIDGTEVFVPIADDNRHYQALLEWVAEGNTITPADS